MNPPNTMASDTLVKAIARAMRNFVESQPAAARELTATTFIRNRDDRLSHAALTAITEAGYAIVRDDELRMANGALSIHGMAPLMAIVSKEAE